MFEYFPKNYALSLSVQWALNMGAQLNEIDAVFAVDRDIDLDNENNVLDYAFKNWHCLGDVLTALAQEDEKQANGLSASRKYLRAAAYFLIAEMHAGIDLNLRRETYSRVLQTFRKGIELSDHRIEFVDIPFEGSSLPSLFLHGHGDAQVKPCVIHFNGFDWTKEVLFLYHKMDLPRRGVSLLICDHPGVGESLRMKGLSLRHDMEVVASACVDYLETRADVDAERIGIVAPSAGGYHAPRAAAYESRIKCCAVWGAIWDLLSVFDHERQTNNESVPDQEQYAAWVMGADTWEQAAKKLKHFTLENVIGKVACPLLIVHGAGDRQVGLWQAERTYDGAVNSSSRELKIFSDKEFATEHCQNDNPTVATDYIFDWLAGRLI